MFVTNCSPAFGVATFVANCSSTLAENPKWGWGIVSARPSPPGAARRARAAASVLAGKAALRPSLAARSLAGRARG